MVIEEKVDHCVALWAIPSGTFARYAMRKTGTKYSVWCLGSDIHTFAKKKLLRKAVEQSLKEASILFADGVGLSQDVKKISGKECRFLPTVRPINVNVPLKTDLAKEYFNLLFVGRLERIKGPDILIEAFKDLLVIRPEAYLTVIGSGVLLNELMEKVKAYNIIEKVQFKGHVSDEELAGYFIDSDCQVIPSRNESIPMVLTEAVKSGNKVVVTDVGDMGQLAREYKLGVVVAPDDPLALKEGIMKVMDEDIKFRRDDYLKIFDINSIVKLLLKDISRA